MHSRAWLLGMRSVYGQTLLQGRSHYQDRRTVPVTHHYQEDMGQAGLRKAGGMRALRA